MTPRPPQWRNFSIRHKLLLLFIVVVVLPAGVTIYLCDRISRKVILDQTQRAVRLDAVMASTVLGTTVHAHSGRLVEEYAAVIGGFCDKPDESLATPRIQQMARLQAKALFSRHPMLDSLTAVGRSGQVIFSETRDGQVGSTLRLGDFEAAWKGRTVLAGPYTRDTIGNSYLEIGVPILSGKSEITEIVIVRVRFSPIIASLEKVVRPDEKIRIILLDGDGIRIWDSAFRNYLMKPTVPLSAERVAAIVSSERFGPATASLVSSTAPIFGYTGTSANPGGGKFFDTRTEEGAGKGFYLDAAGIGAPWRLVYVVPGSVYFGPVNKTVELTLYAALGAAIAALILGTGLSRLIVRPIVMLSGALDRFTRGNVDVSLQWGSRDEIGALARTFNQMVASVKSFQYEIEEQNRDLAKVNFQMTQLNLGLEATVQERTRQIEKEKEILNAVVDHTGVALSILDRDLHVTWSNGIVGDQFRDIDGLRTRADLVAETGGRCNWPVGQALNDGQIHHETILMEKRSGSRAWWQVTAVPIHDPAGETGTVLEMVQDVTEEKVAVQRMLQVEKMSSIGCLASGVAHEFNNIMCAILGHANLAKVNPARSDRLIEVAVRQSARAVKITQGLLSMSRRAETGMQCADLRVLTDEVVSLIESEAQKEGIELVRTYRGEARTLVNESRFQQAMLSLLINARQAIGRDGRIEIVIEGGDKTITIRVADNGRGVEPEFLDNIFEPFVTTKGALGGGDLERPGSGLGLSAVNNIITNHGGTIEVHSTLGEGTTFTIRLPLRHESIIESVPAAVERREAGSARPLQILVADNEEDLRTLLKTILTFDGNEVSAAASPEEVLEAAARHAYDIIFMDLQMHGQVDSMTALEEIKRKTPGTKVVLVSGTDLIEEDEAVFGAADAFIRKPFENDKIREIVYKKLAEDQQQEH